MDKLLQKWQSLSQREQWYVAIAAFFLAILLLYYIIISPLTSAVSASKDQYRYQQNLLAWMQPRVQVLRHSTTGTSTTVKMLSANELLPTLDSRLKTSSFANTITAVSQNNTSGVQVTFKNVPFDDLTAWLVTQWQVSHIRVDSIDVQPSEKAGLTNVNLTLVSS